MTYGRKGRPNILVVKFLVDMKDRLFLRVGHIDSEQGLWYDRNGEFTGHIHDIYSFCRNSGLLMPFDDKVVGYLSAVLSLPELMNWFPINDILALQAHGYAVMEYLASDYKQHAGHWLINQKTSILIKTFKL